MSLPAGCPAPCPGCSHRELSREESEGKKEAWLERELAPWRDRLRPLASPPGRWGYRRKSVLHARLGDGARFELGMIKRLGREELFVPIPDCPVHEPGINELFARVRACASREMPLVFALVSGRVVTVVMKSVRSEATWRALLDWRGHFPADASLFVCWNPVAGHRVLDTRRLELVWGEEWREAEGLWHGPVAFRQQIPGLDESALRAAEEFLAAGDTRAVIDLYCGLGHSLRRWGARGWPCVGVELSGESLAAAARNAPAAKLLRGRVEERLPQLEELAGEWNVYTNPPRLGHDSRVLEWLIARAPERIAYLSCNPRTLARDLAALNGAYEVAEILPFDFFPQTGHVENLALLRRKSGR